MSDLMQSPAVEAEREKYEPMTPKEQLDAALEAYGMDYYLRRVDPDAGDHAYHLAGAKAAVLAAHTACLADGEGLDFVGAVMAAVACQGEDEGDRVFQSDLNAQHGAIVGALKARIQALRRPNCTFNVFSRLSANALPVVGRAVTVHRVSTRTASVGCMRCAPIATAPD